ISFTASKATSGNGGAIYNTVSSNWSLTDSSFTTSEAMNGGAIYWNDGAGRTWTLSDTTFTSNTATTNGGAIYLSIVSYANWTDNTFNQNTADNGGALYYSFGNILTARGNAFCLNTADNKAGGGDGGAMYLSNVGVDADNQYQNNTFVENTAEDDGGALWINAGVGHDLFNNHFLGNASNSGGGLWSSGADLEFSNNLVALTQAGYGVSATGGTKVFDYNAYYSNTSDHLNGVAMGTHSFVAEPDLLKYELNGDCEDKLWPVYTSPLIDAGDPAAAHDDPDVASSDNDIGYTGGPYADTTFHTDGDGDGYTFIKDCDDTDPAQHPGQEWYPDCDGDGYFDVANVQVSCDDSPVFTAVCDDGACAAGSWCEGG
ncbi:MAG: hypothetical protein HN348_35570, partial [Proteobacteria bacterium]|nr:hypothetical protein [Pseudomonadota bacterium]